VFVGEDLLGYGSIAIGGDILELVAMRQEESEGVDLCPVETPVSVLSARVPKTFCPVLLVLGTGL
jgi:hypothetical protein